MKKNFFGTDGIRGRVGTPPISVDWILKLGWAFGTVMSQQGQLGKILIGKDTRVSGYMLESALEAGLSASGMDICLLGPMPTPAIAYLTRTLRAKAGIVISASHNSYQDNGIKFFDSNGIKISDELELAIEEQLNKSITTVATNNLGKASRLSDASGRYIEFCKSAFPVGYDLKGLKIVVDCAHGATYHIAPNVFHELGADVITIGNKPDGFNINKNCGATEPSNLIKTVLQENANLGIALDGDGDRLIMIDEQGKMIDGDNILFIIAKFQYEKGILKGGVVGTIMSNYGLEMAFKKLNIDFVRTAVGDRHIAAELYKRGWQVGGETSGHIICSNVNTTGDGIVAALQILSVMQSELKSLSELHSEMPKYPQHLLNVPVIEQSAVMENAKLIKCLNTIKRQLAGKGRVLIRPSGTESVVRIMVEGTDENFIGKAARKLAVAVKEAHEEVVC